MEFDRMEALKESTFSKMRRKIAKRANEFLYSQNHISAELYFLFYFVSLMKLDRTREDASSQQVVFVIGVILCLYFNINYYFYYICLIELKHIALLIPKIALGLAAANQKWKVYILIFSLGSNLSGPFLHYRLPFQLAVSLVIAFTIYNSLILPSVADNIKYFVGFSVIFMLHAVTAVLEQGFGVSLPLPIFLMQTCLLSFLAYITIAFRFKKVEEQKPGSIRNPIILWHHIQILIHCPFLIEKHAENCSKVECLCRNSSNRQQAAVEGQHRSKVEWQIINSIFKQAIEQQQWSGEQNLTFVHKYLQYLLEDGHQLPVLNLLSTQTNATIGYYRKVERHRTWKKFMSRCNSLGYFDGLHNKYNHVYGYDMKLGYVNKEMKAIIKGKKEFWKQVGNTSPQLKVLQTRGCSLVQKMKDLHQFYLLQIKPTEEQILNFNCTIMYATYLFFTTSNTSQAESMFKKVQDKIRQMGLNTPTEVYGLETVIEQSMPLNQQPNLFLRIINISDALAQLLSCTKKSLLNQNLEQLIPEPFRETHNVAFNRSAKICQFMPQTQYSFMYRTIQLPFHVSSSQIMFLQVNNRINTDLYSGRVCFQSIVYRSETVSFSTIIDLSKKVVLEEPNPDEIDVLKHKGITKSLDELINTIKSNIQHNIGIDPSTHKILNIEMDSEVYRISLAPHLANSLSRIGRKPLIRIKVENENFKLDKTEYVMIEKVKQNVFEHYNTDNDSQGSLNSRKDTIENVVLLLQKEKWLKTQKLTCLFFVLVFLGAFCSIFVRESLENQNFLTSNSPQRHQSLSALKTIFQINILFSKAFNWELNLNLYKREKEQGFEDVLAQLYHGRSFELICQQTHQQLFSTLLELIHSTFQDHDNPITQLQMQVFGQIIEISNITGSNNSQPIKMQIQGVIMNMITEIRFQKNNTHPQTLFSKVYQQQIAQQLAQLIQAADSAFDNNINQIQASNILTVCILSFLLTLLLLPFWKLVSKSKKNQIDIHNALVALNPDLIVSQIRKLSELEHRNFYPPFNSEGQTTNKKSTFADGNVNVSSCNKMDVQLQDAHKVNNHQYQEQQADEEYFQGIRTRAGELRIEGSECDRKKVRKLDWFFFIFILLLVVWVICIFLLRQQRLNILILHKQKIVNVFEATQTNEFQLMATKIFLDSQPQQVTHLQFMGQQLEVWLRSNVREQISKTEPSNYQDNFLEINKCSQNQLLCTKSYSMLLLDGMVKKVIYDSFTWKKRTTLQNKTEDAGISEHKMRLRTFFGQQVASELYSLQTQSIKTNTAEFETRQAQISENLSLLTNFVLLLLLLFLGLSWIYVIRDKKVFASNVTVLLFLTRQMVQKNKRIQSYIARLSKQLR